MTILTGIKPTGHLHLGNYVGAIRPLAELARSSTEPVYTLVADLHALNYMRDPAQLGELSRECAAALMACAPDAGITLHRSSRIAEIGQIAAIIASYTPKGYMNRAHAYKVAAAENDAADVPTDSGVNMGLYTYPLLMAADIFAVGADKVPVGPDQLQHLEIAQEIARSVNHRFGDALTVPDAIADRSMQINGTDGRKMSKSYDNTIPLFGPGRSKQLKRIATDSRPMADPKDPAECNLFALYELFATPAEIAQMRALYAAGGFGYGTVKAELVAAVDRELAAAEARYDQLMGDPGQIDARLMAGEAVVRHVAQKQLSNLVARLGL